MGRSSPFLATLFGGSAERKAEGRSPQISVEPFEVLQRDIQIGAGTAAAHIAPSASDTTAIGTTKTTDVRALYGGLTCCYDYAPMSLNEWIHGGTGARHPYKNIHYDIIANNMTQLMLQGLFSTGAGANPDGLLKWISLTADKWGIDTSQAANYFYRGHSMTPAAADFDEDLLREYIRLCATGEISQGGLQHSNGDPKIGLLDSKLFNKLQKMVSERQVINMSRTEELAKIGGYFKKGITIDQVTFFPDLILDWLKGENSSNGELFILNPDDFELIFLKGFAFDWVTDPDKAFAASGGKFDVRQVANVVWGQYMINIALYNWYCSFPRGQLYATFS